MTKTILMTLAVTLVVGLACSAALAEETDHAAKMEKMSGKDLYKGLCKQCHGPEGEDGEFTPMTLIQEQWDEFFDGMAESHAEVACPSDDSKKLMEVLTKDALKKLRKFCVDHAADSEQPMTCG